MKKLTATEASHLMGQTVRAIEGHFEDSDFIVAVTDMATSKSASLMNEGIVLNVTILFEKKNNSNL
jgi:hypothetical protein